MCDKQIHKHKLIYICFYFKHIEFVMDIVPIILNFLDDVYIHDVIQDAFNHGWTTGYYHDQMLSPPLIFDCSRWSAHWTKTPRCYLVPHWIYDENVRRKGTWRDKELTCVTL